MHRRKFFAGAAAFAPPLAAQSVLPSKFSPSAFSVPSTGYSPFTTPDYYTYADNLAIERNVPDKPHAGKVLAAVQAHSDDIPLFAAGTVAKLIDEGYTGYLIRLSDDGNAGQTLGYGVAQNEIDNQKAAEALGCKKAFSFYYRNHRMDDCAVIEIRARLIFLFRLLQVNTIVCMDPYNHYDENPDHIVAGKAVEGACWMSGSGKDYPEHYKLGLKPARIREKYYFARSPQGHNLVNRVVDISSYIDTKVRVNMASKGKGPAGNAGARLRQELLRQGRKMPLLGGDDETANFQYIKFFLMEDYRLFGKLFGCEYAEAFRYIGPMPNYLENIRKYANSHTVPA
jgi:LmbE family N-acetylglucosaminyl deacetylase